MRSVDLANLTRKNFFYIKQKIFSRQGEHESDINVHITITNTLINNVKVMSYVTVFVILRN